ncbi:MAG: hypothetical protein WD824_09615 [Cyclobacteriaceae bacterium]
MEHTINMLTANYIRKDEARLKSDKVECLLSGKELIIEFVGPTGSGKTTNCIHFLEFFKKRNVNAYTFNDIKIYLGQLTFYHRLQICFKAILLNGHDVLSYSFLLACHRIYSFDSIYRYIKLCIFNSTLSQFMRVRKVDAVFLDQWIIQGLWSATIFKAKTFDKLPDELKRFYFNTDYVLYFDIDEETACERIHQRESGRSRFDKMGREQRLSELKRNNPYLFRLYQNSACKNKLKFSTRESPGKNAEEFFQQLEYSLTRE